MALAISPDNRWIAAAAGWYDGSVRIWSRDNGLLRHTLTNHQGWITQLRFTEDSQRLIGAGQDLIIRLWDVETGQEERRLRGHEKPIGSLAYSPARRAIVSGDEGGQVK